MLHACAALIGLALMAISIAAFFDNNYNNQVDSATSYINTYASIGLVFGAVLVIFASCIISGVARGSRVILGCSSMAFLVISMLLMIEGSAFAVVLRSVKEVADNSHLHGSSGLTGINRYINDFELGVFDGCCKLGMTQRAQCLTETQAMLHDAACFYDEDTYNAGRDVSEGTEGNEDEEKICENFVKKNFCQDTTVFSAFEDNVSDFCQKQFAQVSKLFLILGPVLFLAFIGSFYLCCRGRSTPGEVLVTEYVVLVDQEQP